jgi:hypothetical protein
VYGSVRKVMLMSDADSQDMPGPLEPPVPQDAMLEFAHHIVNRLFSIGLSLDSARSIVGKGPAGDRVAAATDEVDRLIREIRDYVFAGRGQGTQAGRPEAFGADRRSRGAAARAHGANGPCIAGQCRGLRRTARAKGRLHQAARPDGLSGRDQAVAGLC